MRRGWLAAPGSRYVQLMSALDEVRRDLFSSPDIAQVTPSATVPQRSNERLVAYLDELQSMLSTLKRLQRSAHSADDWLVVMNWIAMQKPRLSELLADAKAIYAKAFGDSYDDELKQGRPDAKRGDGVTQRTAEIRAKRNAHMELAAQERLQSTWKDFEQLVWTAKQMAERAASDHQTASFDAFPAHLFPEMAAEGQAGGA